jgi:hypothetical protein
LSTSDLAEHDRNYRTRELNELPVQPRLSRVLDNGAPHVRDPAPPDGYEPLPTGPDDYQAPTVERDRHDLTEPDRYQALTVERDGYEAVEPDRYGFAEPDLYDPYPAEPHRYEPLPGEVEAPYEPAAAGHDHYEPATLEDPGGGQYVDDYSGPYVIAYARWFLVELDWTVTVWMATHAIRMLQLGIGSVFFWFGALKLVPGWSPAENLVELTLQEMFALAGFSVPVRLAVVLLALWEVGMGLSLLLDRYRRAVVWLLLIHMASTAMPMLLLPELVWTAFAHVLTLEGQYIVKNLVIVAGVATIGATVNGGYLTSMAPGAADDEVDPAGDWDEPIGARVARQAGQSTAAGAPKVWIVNEDGSLVASYELEDYYANEKRYSAN